MFEKIIKKFMNMNTAFYVLLALFIIFMWHNIDLSLILFVSLVFASSLNPLVDKLSKKMNRTSASFIVIFGAVALFLGFIIPILILCAQQISAFAVEFPKYTGNIDQLTAKYPILSKLGLATVSFDEIFSSAANFSSDFVHGIMGLFSGIGSISLYFFITIIFVFFLISDKKYIKQSVLKLFPSNLRNKTEHILDIVGMRLGGYLTAQLCAVASVGIIMAIGLWIFSIPYAVLLAIITAILDLIPVVGPALALVICIIAVYETGVKSIIIVSIIFAIAQIVENNLVRPYVFGKLLNLHPMLIFIFLIIGTKYFGILGTLFAPAIAATFCVLIEELYIKNVK